MKLFQCNKCQHVVYFRNNRCIRCDNSLAFDPQSMSMQSPDNALCENGVQHGACNWLADAGSDNGLCIACNLNRTIPPLTTARNLSLWQDIQLQRNHLVYSLLRFGLPVHSRESAPDTGLAFDFLDAETADQDDDVRTGHAGGVITIDIREADDAYREMARQQMDERYRTLLGHLRHESAHYYWDVLVRHSPFLDRVRTVFGDDREDYQQALSNHYASGPPEAWEERYISAYASSHAWEDWAETWSHYFHMVDALECANELGLALDPETGRTLTTRTVSASDPYRAESVENLIEQWLPISVALNMLNRSLGQQDAYPFVLNTRVIEKLSLIHDIVRTAALTDG